MDTYDTIASNVAYYYNMTVCNTINGEVVDESVNMDHKPPPIDENYIQFYYFDSKIVDYAYYEKVLKFVNTPLVNEISENFGFEDVIDFLVSDDMTIHFRVLPRQIKFSQMDLCGELRFKYNNDVKICKCVRKEDLFKFTQRFFRQ